MDITHTYPPSGFDVASSAAGDTVIRYRATGMGCLALFEVVWLTGWTAACVALTAQLLSGDGVALPFVVIFWLIDVSTAGLMAWHRFAVHRFVFEVDRLVVRQSLLWYRRGWIVQRRQIAAVTQVKDGGEGEDSFPSWGLTIEATAREKMLPDRPPALVRYLERGDAKSPVPILSRQSIEKSDWLGPIVARWAGVSFTPAEARR